MRFLVLAIAFLFAFLAFSPPVLAQSQSGNAGVNAIFNEVEKRLIRNYFGQQTTNAGRIKFKKGKGGKGRGAKGRGGRGGGLPPGLAMQLQRNGTLPPGLAKKALPPGLSGRLPPLAAGTQRFIVNNDVVLIQLATGLILDILSGVLH